jgi:hypothetical protein
VRETVWRWGAEQRFAESLTHLGAVDPGDEVYGLASTWRAQRQWRDANATRSLRSQFYNLVSGEGGTESWAQETHHA